MNPLFKFKELAEKFPAVQATAPTVTPPVGQTLCACGKKFMPMSEIKIVKTRYCTATDNICDACLQHVKTHSTIVCTRCKSVAARLAPHRDPSGFVFEAGKSYHTPFCPNCQQDCVSSPIAEKAVWDQEQNRK